VTVPFVLDRAGGTPLHRQIYDRWRAAILGGHFRSGERVPSTRAFAETYRVSRVTVTAAYDQLLAEGYFETRIGAGTFISQELPDEALRPSRVTRSAPTPVRGIRLSAFASRLDRIRQLPPSSHALNLSNVSPDLARFPFPLWRRLISRHLKEGRPEIFDHRAAPTGHPGLREAIVGYLGRARAVRCEPEQVVVVSGSQQALDLCARLLLDPGDEVAVEEPGYPGARQLFLAHGATLRTLPVMDGGVSIEGLSAPARLVHLTPSHQFPTGVSMSLARRLEWIEWARTSGAVLLEDDYDSEYRYSGPPLPAMHGLADGAGIDSAIIYIGTFSNVMFRGLRVGYLVVPKDLVEPFRVAKWLADRHTPLVEQAALADFLNEGHLERHVRRMRRLYKRRRDALLESLDRHFGRRAFVRGDAAGLHMTVRFSGAGNLVAHAAQHDVHLSSSDIYYMARPTRSEFILGFSAESERALREGVRRLALRD
jgi:GntR family transcriptional regulator / MocR family aminotransferase